MSKEKSVENRQAQNKIEQQSSTQTWRSVHTYTPRSHENLMREFSKVSSMHMDVDRLQRENERLAAELKKAKKQLERKQEVVKSLEIELKETRMNTSAVDNVRVHELEASPTDKECAEILTEHFSEVIRRHHNVLAQKDRQIRELQEALARKCNQRPEQQIWTHDFRVQPSTESDPLRHDVAVQHVQDQPVRREVAVEDERLRRTEAAVQVFRDELDLLKTQLCQSPLAEQRYTPSSTHDKVVVKELENRRNFCMITDIEKMGRDFLRKLAFEEKLDKLHWAVETRRVQVMKDKANNKVEPTCTYIKELEMLESTRNNLLKALRTLMNRPADDKQHEKNKAPHPHVHFKDDINLTTIQSIYKPSDMAVSSKSSHEWPDK